MGNAQSFWRTDLKRGCENIFSHPLRRVNQPIDTTAGFEKKVFLYSFLDENDF